MNYFFARFLKYKLLLEEVISLILVIIVSRSIKSLSNVPFYLLFVDQVSFLIFGFMFLFLHQNPIINSNIFTRHNFCYFIYLFIYLFIFFGGGGEVANI